MNNPDGTKPLYWRIARRDSAALDELRGMFDNERSNQSIADEIGCTIRSVTTYRRLFSPTPRRPGRPVKREPGAV